MKQVIQTRIERFPKRISIQEALHFYTYQSHLHDILMVMATGWLTNPEPREEFWFLELGPDEFEEEDFLEDFADADFEIWVR
jgi:hypothetical protein